jgi:peptidoglycan/xylan/chitin deacetylase (PgdA/CDA1 family)
MGLDRRALLGQAATGATAAVAGGWSVRVTDRPRAAAVPPSSLAAAAIRGQAGIWWSAPTSEPDLALTFDDGPTPSFTVAVLDLLARFDVRATFFVIGAQVERNPDLVRRAWAAGHEIANHSHDHVRASRAAGRSVAESMTRGADAVERVTGRRPRWYRPSRCGRSIEEVPPTTTRPGSPGTWRRRPIPARWSCCTTGSAGPVSSAGPTPA